MDYAILVIENDSGIQTYLKELLLDHGYSVHTVADGSAALHALKKAEMDLVVLGLPIDADTICQEIRRLYPDLPIIILTAKDSDAQILHRLDLEADDYLTKPVQAAELLARIKVWLHKNNQIADKLIVADLVIDNKSLDVTRAGKKIKLTPQEFKLLQYLMHNKGRILTREMILSRIWASSFDIETRVVDVYMGYLRKKIDATFKKKLLRSVRGFGYMINE